MRIHISLNVNDVQKSVAFYEKAFAARPQKQTESYAKFDLKEPALNFSMQSSSEQEISRVNHFGIEVDSAEAVKQWEKWFEDRGVLTKPESNTECCFARQDKVWFQDPDGNTWEVFYVHEQLPVEPKKNSCATSEVFGKKCC